MKDLAFLCRDYSFEWTSWIWSFLPLWLVPRPLVALVLYPFSLMFYFYVRLPVSVVQFYWNFVLEVVHALSRRSAHTRQMAVHVVALGDSLLRMWESVINIKLSELLLTVLQAIFEVFSSWTSAASSDEQDKTRGLSMRELHGLLSYEEFDDDSEFDIAQQRKMRSQMHHYIPINPFRAVTRAPSTDLSGRPLDYAESTTSAAAAAAAGGTAADDADSPASFPPTPFSRARVMSYSTERVVSTMFAARDRLRIEAQSVSRDEYSRKAAVEAQTSGQMAVFDPRQTSDGLALTCGNHCALKVGRGLCCSSRAMIPVRLNAFVYIEFSVTAQSGQTPSLALGLAPSDCPLNVMVGSWPGSIGLYADGQLLIGSRWFSGHASVIEAGSTIGILTYLPGSGGAEHEQAQGQGQGQGGKRAAATAIDKDGAAPSSAAKARTVAPTRIAAGTGSSGDKHPAPLAEIDSPKQQRREAEESIRSPEMSVPLPFTLNISVNGRPATVSSSATEAALSVSSNEAPLYPTISLLSQDTRVWCRFCEADMVYRSRAALQAPPGVRVYCLDGSLLLNESV